MKKMKSNWSPLALTALALVGLVLVGCPLSGTPGVEQEYGTLVLSLPGAVLESKSTVLPPLDMDIVYYNVNGSGPESETFSQANVTGTSVVESSLIPGTWTVTVDAHNATDEWIGTGTVTATVFPAQITEVSVTVAPLDGTGTLNVSLDWPVGGVTSPSVTATLEDTTGVIGNPVFTVTDGSATYTDSTLAVGYYFLTVQLTGTHTDVTAPNVAFRILKDQTTQISFSLTAEDVNAPGGIELTITPEMDDPIAVTFAGQQSPLAPGADMTVTATTLADPVDSYQWYLNGAAVTGETSFSITIGSALAEGSHRLDLRVIKGNVIASQSYSFVVGNEPATVTIAGVVDGGVYDTAVTPTWTTASGTVDEAVLVTNSLVVSGYQKGDAVTIADASTFPTEAKVSTLTVTTTDVNSGLTAETSVEFLQFSSLPSQVVQTNSTESGTALDIYFIGGPEVNIDFRTPLYVFWVEALDGTFLHNLFVTDVPATNRMRYHPAGALLAKPSSVPYWAHKASVEDPYAGNEALDTTGLYLALPTIDGGPIPADLDAVTGATPLGAPVGTEEDFLVQTARTNDDVGQVRVLLEVNKGRNSNGYHDYDEETNYYAWDSGQPSLVYATEVDTTTPNRFFRMALIGAGHEAGSDGGLYSTNNHTTALDMVAVVIVHVK